jgi:predicted phage tail protein
MVTIKLLGELGRRFGRQFQLAVKTPAEAMRALCTQLPGMRQYLLESGEKGVNWRVVTEHPDGLSEDQLLWPLSKRMVVAPQPAGRGATGKIVAGVALVALAFILPGAQLGLFGLGQIGLTAFAPIVGTLGGAMLFSGVADLLTPTPRMPNVSKGAGGGISSGRSREEQLNSFTFDKSNANTMQGEVVPVLYGERIVGNLPILSFGLELQNHL